MACAAIAYPSPVPSSTVVRPPRRIAGSRPASPYARAAPSLNLKPKLRPLTLNVSLALNVDAPCGSGGGATLSRIRRHVYSASAPSLSPSKCSPYPCSLASSSSSSSSSSSNSNDLYSAPTSTSTSAADSKFACTSSPSRSHSNHSYSYSCPASAVSLSVAADHSPYPVSLSLKSTIAHADADAPPSPPSPSSSSSSTEDEAIYFSAPTSPASALFSPRGGNYTFSPTTPSFAASSFSFASAGAWAPPPPPLLANPNPSIRRDSGVRRSPSPSPIVFFAPPPLHCRDLPAGPSRTSPLLTSPFNSIAAPRALTSSSIPGTGTSRSRHPDNPLLAASPPSFSHITPHLLIGDLAFAERADLLEREGVTHVVSVLRERVHIPACILPAHRLHVPLDDAPFAELVGLLGGVVEWVRGVLEQDTSTTARILIHCAHGISRSPAVGAALLVALPLVECQFPEGDGQDGDVEMGMATELEGEGEGWTSPARHCASPASFFPPSSASSFSVPSSAFTPAFSGAPIPSGTTPALASTALASSTSLSSTTTSLHPPPPPTARRTLSAPAALAYVSARRPAADVNWGFRAQLREWEGVCRGAGAASSL